MMKRAAIIGALLLGVAPLGIPAQALRGKVVQPSDGHGVAGVLVLVIDSTGNVVARALSDEHGEYRVAVPRSGAYRVRTLRIGYQPSSLIAVELSARVALVQQLELTSQPLALGAVRVSAPARCSPFAGSPIIASVWEQARTAFSAAEVTSQDRLLHATVVRTQRVLDPRSGRLKHESSRQLSGFVTKPWGTVPPDSLRRFGYVYRLRDGTMTYYAPDIETLLSEDFLQDHCFRFTSGRDSLLLGIAFEPARGPERPVAFEPARGREHLLEIRGTVWLDRESAELRRLEFHYLNPRSRDRSVTGSNVPRGIMHFSSMMNGGWAISQWELRIPLLRERLRPNSSGYEELTETYVSAVHVETGLLKLVTRGPDTLWRAK